MAAKFVDKTSSAMNRISDVMSEPKHMLPPIQGYENERITTLEKAVKSIQLFVPDVEQMVAKIKQKCDQPKENLTSDESASIMLYTLEWDPKESSFYVILNRTLRTENRQKLKPWFLYLRLVISALAKLPSATHRIIYRGIKKDVIQDYQKGQTIIWWAFSSCTSSIEVLKEFLGPNTSGTIFNIECDSAKDISQHSIFRSENEILFYPARQFQIISSLKTGDFNRIIHLKEIQTRIPLIHIPKMSLTTIKTTSTSSINQQLNKKIQEYDQHSKIDLSSQNLEDDDINIIVKEVIINKQCTWLYLERNNITSLGVSIIAKALNDNRTLEWLDISYNHLGNEGVHYLTRTLSMNNSKLKALYLWSTGITDEGAEYLGEMLKINTKLTHLGLAENKISNVGVQYLINVLIYHNNTLTELDLSLNSLLNDSSIDSFVQMLNHNRSLTEINMENCNFSPKGKEKLQQTTKSKNSFNLRV